MAAQPIVILGGFLITGEAYAPMCRWLEQRCDQPVRLVPVSRIDWLFTVGAWGWRRLLDRTAALVDRRYPGVCFAEVLAQWWCD